MRVLGVALILAQGHGCGRRPVPSESNAHDDTRDAFSDQRVPSPWKSSPSKSAEPAAAGLPPEAPGIRPNVATRIPSGAAVIDFETQSPWDRRCMVRQACTIMPRTLHHCTANAKRDAQSHLDAPEHELVGRLVHVKGALTVASVQGWLERCPPPTCCSPTYAPIVVRTESELVELEGLSCGGDESRMCCNAPALGQAVIATGELTVGSPLSAKWKLVNAELCLDN